MAKNLISLDRFKTYKGITNTEDDNKLNAIITNVSSFVKTYCNRSFIDYSTQDIIEYFNDPTLEMLFVREIPIISITSVEISSDGGKIYTAYTDFYDDKDLGYITTGTGVPFVYTNIKHKSVKISYKGGYIKLPLEIEQAVLDLVEYYREEEYTPRKAFQGMSIENLGFREGGTGGLPGHIKRTLELYRVVT